MSQNIIIYMYLSGMDEGLTRVDHCEVIRGYHEWKSSGSGIIQLQTESVILVACSHFTSHGRHLHMHYSNWCPPIA